MFQKYRISALSVLSVAAGSAFAVFPNSSNNQGPFYTGVGLCGTNTNLSSFVFISSHWALTSRHSDSTFVVADEGVFEPAERIDHPEADIALLRFNETIVNFYTPFYGDVVGSTVDIVGCGRTGVETSTGFLANGAIGTRIAARNDVDVMVSATLDGVDFFDSYLYDLDNRSTSGTLGGPRVNGEGGMAEADSGGGWFVDVAGSHRVVAINSFVLDVDGNNDLFNFGDQGGAVALKSYEGWIESHINPVPEPTSMAALGLGIVAFLRKRSKSSK